MAFKFSATAAILLLVSGAALADPIQPAKECGTTVATGASGSAASAGTSASGGPEALAVPRTRAQVHAEAVEAARQDRSTLARELDFLTH
jgi:hypothetical protein